MTGKNSPEWAVAYFGVLTAGAVVVPLDYQLPVPELANLVKAGDVVALFVDEEKEAELSGSSRGLKAVFSLAAGRPGNVLDLDASGAPAFDKPAEGDLAAILFTSGTMGSPKGVMLTHRNLVSDAYLSQANLPIYHTDVFYALLPIHHAYTMLAVFIEGVAVGAEIVFAKRMVIKQVLKDLKEAKVTMFLGVPLLFNKLLAGIMRGIKEKGPIVYGLIKAMMGLSFVIKKLTRRNPGKKLFHSVLDKASLSSIRICISGGGPLAPSVFRHYNELGIDFVQGYGLTEDLPHPHPQPDRRLHHHQRGQTRAQGGDEDPGAGWRGSRRDSRQGSHGHVRVLQTARRDCGGPELRRLVQNGATSATWMARTTSISRAGPKT